MTGVKQDAVKAIKLDFGDEPVTAFGGLALVEQVARRLGLWRELEKAMPSRRSGYDWLTVIKSVVAGLLTGAQGTYAAEAIREEGATQTLLGLEGAPEEVTVWRLLGQLGGAAMQERLAAELCRWSRRTLQRGRRRDLLVEGFFPVFADGSLLEGSERREATKVMKEKGRGILWTTIFAGPVLAAQRVAADGEGEETCVRGMLPKVMENIVKPLKLADRALVLMDSLHGDGPTLDLLESMGVHYIVGANKLTATAATLAEQPDFAWTELGAQPARGWTESAVCVCSLQCAEWTVARTLVGRRWKKAGEFIYEYSGVLTGLTKEDVAHIMKQRQIDYAQAIWRLYDHKAGMETQYKDALEDLGMHHPPCQQYVRNAGFYALGALACVLGRAVQLLARPMQEMEPVPAANAEPAVEKPVPPSAAKTGATAKRRRRRRPRFMRLWRLRRSLLALPARITRHARTVTVTLLGLTDRPRQRFQHFWSACCRC